MKKPETKPETKPREIELEDLEPSAGATESIKGGAAAGQESVESKPKLLRGGWDGN